MRRTRIPKTGSLNEGHISGWMNISINGEKRLPSICTKLKNYSYTVGIWIIFHFVETIRIGKYAFSWFLTEHYHIWISVWTEIFDFSNASMRLTKY